MWSRTQWLCWLGRFGTGVRRTPPSAKLKAGVLGHFVVCYSPNWCLVGAIGHDSANRSMVIFDSNCFHKRFCCKRIAVFDRSKLNFGPKCLWQLYACNRQHWLIVGNQCLAPIGFGICMVLRKWPEFANRSLVTFGWLHFVSGQPYLTYSAWRPTNRIVQNNWIELALQTAGI